MRDESARQCSYVRPEDGLRCRAYAMSDSDVCYVHSLDIEERKQMSARGGRARTRKDKPDVQEDVRKDIEHTIRTLLAARLPDGDFDFRRRALGVALAARVYTPSATLDDIAARLLPPELHGRLDEVRETANVELERALEELHAQPVKVPSLVERARELLKGVA
jgi:hypothetical protein